MRNKNHIFNIIESIYSKIRCILDLDVKFNGVIKKEKNSISPYRHENDKFFVGSFVGKRGSQNPQDID